MEPTLSMRKPSDAPHAPGLLSGKRVAFTGRLASMTRSEAARLVASQGGIFAASVGRQPSILVVGREGWPLAKDGRLTAKLRQARWLARSGADVAIISEDELLAKLHVDGDDRLRRRSTAAELTGMLGISRDRLRSWMRCGLIAPVERVGEVCYFDFSQVAGAKSLCDLASAGVTTARLRQSLRQLQAWLGDIESPLAQLTVLEQSSRVLVRLADGQLAEPSGQLHFDFSPSALSADMPAPVLRWAAPPRSALDWFAEGSQAEQSGDFQIAVRAYRGALLAGGPSAAICFNLANSLYALDKKAEAGERFRQAVELDPTFCDAWNNLGTVLAELDQADEAIEAYRQALVLDPHCADAHYNLADLLDSLGHSAEAQPHWQAYLERDPAGPWADFARSRLQA